MRTIFSMRNKCDRLFSRYPLAVRESGEGAPTWSMVLMVQVGGMAQFHVLSYTDDQRRAFFSLLPWPGGQFTDIEEEVKAGRPASEVRRILRRGIPIPVHGSLFGWRHGDRITALIAIYARYSSPHKEPSWTVMPLVEIPQGEWPTGTTRTYLGKWFWRAYRAGRVLPLSTAIAQHPQSVFWVDTTPALGSGSYAVANQLTIDSGCLLPSGRYVYHQALRAGQVPPSLAEMLADPTRVDLSPAFC